MKHKLQSGFTLVELAIVLMIIGLLIGGVLRGQELMENARITATIQQVKAYTAAFHTFNDQYNGMPGDMPLAATRLAGCEIGNTNSCLAGNGDGFIGVVMPRPWCCDLNSNMTNENQQFWKHLALAHLISGVDPSANHAEWGHSNPISKNNAGFFVMSSSYTNTTAGGSGSGTGMSGNLFLMRRSIDGLWDCGGGGAGNSNTCAISPLHAAQLDRKMDDGIAVAGDVQGVSSNWENGCGVPGSGPNGPNGYDETKTANACELFFRF